MGTGVDIQDFKKRRVTTEMREDTWKGMLINGQGFESTSMGYHQSKLVVGNFATLEVEIQRRSLNVGYRYGSCRCSQSPNGSTTKNGI
jgi:hypothetical protein